MNNKSYNKIVFIITLQSVKMIYKKHIHVIKYVIQHSTIFVDAQI